MVVASMGGKPARSNRLGRRPRDPRRRRAEIVPDLATALRRVEEYAYPLEDARAQETYGIRSAIRKLLVLNGDFPGRTTVILVREPVGI